jgi:hypothetical protein
MRRATPQSGNVIVIILIGIVLFAALSYAVTGSLRGGANDGSTKQDLVVTDVLAYANAMQATVRTLILGGCTENQISFQSPALTNNSAYANASAPADKSCHVFEPSGGGLRFAKPMKEIADTSITGTVDWNFSPRAVNGIGSGNVDLVATVASVRKEFCIAVNKKFGIVQAGYETPQQGWGTAYFSGSYPTGAAVVGFDATSNALAKQPVGCLKRTNGTAVNTYILYYVLSVR